MTETEAQVAMVARRIRIAIAEWLDGGDLCPEFGLRWPFLLDKLYPNFVIVQNKPLQQCWPLLMGEDRVPSHVDLAHALNSMAPRGRERLRLSELIPAYIRLDGQEEGPPVSLRVWSYAVPMAAVADFRRSPEPRPQDKDQIDESRFAEDPAQLRYRIDELEAENVKLRSRLEEYELFEATPETLAESLGVKSAAPETHVVRQTREEFEKRLPIEPAPPPKKPPEPPKKPPKRRKVKLKPDGW